MKQKQVDGLNNEYSDKAASMRQAMLGDLNCSYPIYRDRKLG